MTPLSIADKIAYIAGKLPTKEVSGVAAKNISQIKDFLSNAAKSKTLGSGSQKSIDSLYSQAKGGSGFISMSALLKTAGLAGATAAGAYAISKAKKKTDSLIKRYSDETSKTQDDVLESTILQGSKKRALKGKLSDRDIKVIRYAEQKGKISPQQSNSMYETDMKYKDPSLQKKMNSVDWSKWGK